MNIRIIKQLDGLLGFMPTWAQVGILLLCYSLSLNASTAGELDQATLKVLYSYKFGKFTNWPEAKLNASSDSFQYCILGQNPFPQVTQNMIIGKPIQGIPLAIDLFDYGLIPEEVLTTCHILFISKSERHRLATILTRLKQTPVLTVSDIHGFSRVGGMITLVEDHGKLRFQINLDSLQQAGISISSKILELAEIVNTRQGL
ncbi:YfiR family protein [Methyloprofundus sp.]|uniref:YfiR family protein n=1 Tax=Methyloprofundus sp. TaxID=2020875 RepID=UPI003D14DB4D